MAEDREPFTTPDVAHVREAMREHDENVEEDAAHPRPERRSGAPEQPAPTPGRPD